MSKAYYNEIDPRAAAWLRELIKQGHIADGVVDTRSITDVKPDELSGFAQCHFFAGIGVWSSALRLAGWPDDRPVWTGSCPCQPFSSAGKGAGFADERHLWPAWHWLIRNRHPGVVFGEQVASKDGLAWLDLVLPDLEGEDYTPAAIDLCAAGVGAPHLRQRLWFVAYSKRIGLRGQGPAAALGEAGGVQEENRERQWIRPDPGSGSLVVVPSSVADTDCERHPGKPILLRAEAKGRGRTEEVLETPRRGTPGKLGDTHRARAGRRSRQPANHGPGVQAFERTSGPVNGFWGSATWVACTDGKARAVEPGSFPLAYGSPARVGRLRGYGNAIVRPVATEFIQAFMQSNEERN